MAVKWLLVNITRTGEPFGTHTLLTKSVPNFLITNSRSTTLLEVILELYNSAEPVLERNGHVKIDISRLKYSTKRP